MKGLFGSLFNPERKAEVLSELPGFLMQGESQTGIAVNWHTALQVSAMFACARVIGNGIAQSRARLYRPRGNGQGGDVAKDHPLHRLLFLEPSEGFTAFDMWMTICIHLLFVGNAYVFVNRVSGGRVAELIVLEPGKVRVTRRADLSLFYEVTGDDGRTQTMPKGAIWHIRGASWNGWMGLETVKLARESLGLSLALEQSHARQHKSGTQPAGVYSINDPLGAEEFEKLAKWLKRFSTAGDMQGMPLILDRGAKWMAQQMTGVDQEHLATRRFQIEEVCRTAGVMPIMVGLADKVATYASSEQMFLAHEVHCIAPRAGHLEQSAEVSLLTEAEKAEGLYVKLNTNALLRGSFKERQEGLAIQRRNGVISANEWRDLEDKNPRADAGGDQYIVEANMALQDGRDLPVQKPDAKPVKEETN